MQSLGVIVVTSAGTPVVLSSASRKCTEIIFQPMQSLAAAGTRPTPNAGFVYILNSSAAKGAASTNVLLALDINQPAVTLRAAAKDGYDLSRIWVDADNSSDGVLVSYV